MQVANDAPGTRQAFAGVEPAPGWLKMIREKCTEYGIVFILDEVKTAEARKRLRQASFEFTAALNGSGRKMLRPRSAATDAREGASVHGRSTSRLSGTSTALPMTSDPAMPATQVVSSQR